jgi:hypothetical protein
MPYVQLTSLIPHMTMDVLPIKASSSSSLLSSAFENCNTVIDPCSLYVQVFLFYVSCVGRMSFVRSVPRPNFRQVFNGYAGIKPSRLRRARLQLSSDFLFRFPFN